MSTVIEKPSATAHDTLAQKSRDEGIVSGGHLVARALKNEGVNTVFTLCGGHIIDIYDGCLDEGIRIVDVRHEQTAAHAADGYARQTGKLGCVVTTAGARLHQRGHRRRDRLPLGKPDPPYRRAELAHPAPDGLAPGFAACRHDDADHQVRIRRVLHRTGCRHGGDGGARMLQRRLRGRAYLEIPRDVLDARECRWTKPPCRNPEPGAYRDVDALGWRPGRY